MARIISIVNQKGGTGKSACTANLAVGLAQKNMKVLIVDADPQSDVSAGFGYRDCDDSNETLTALMDAVMKDEDIPSDCYIRHQAEGIDIICSNIGLAGTEVQLVNAMSREYVLIGGTSIIIVVGVALETTKALEAQMLMRHYKGFLE